MGAISAHLLHGLCILGAELKMTAGIWFHSTTSLLLRKCSWAGDCCRAQVGPFWISRGWGEGTAGSAGRWALPAHWAGEVCCST